MHCSAIQIVLLSDTHYTTQRYTLYCWPQPAQYSGGPPVHSVMMAPAGGWSRGHVYVALKIAHIRRKPMLCLHSAQQLFFFFFPLENGRRCAHRHGLQSLGLRILLGFRDFNKQPLSDRSTRVQYCTWVRTGGRVASFGHSTGGGVQSFATVLEPGAQCICSFPVLEGCGSLRKDEVPHLCNMLALLLLLLVLPTLSAGIK